MTKVLAVILIPGCVAGIYSGNKSSEERAQAVAAQEAAKSPEQRASEAAAKLKSEAEFQAAVRAAAAVKAGMKNPDSFELTVATLTEAGALCLRYRGTNSFNAIVPGYAVFPAKGKPVAGSESDVAESWNKHCANKAGRDMKYIRQAL